MVEDGPSFSANNPNTIGRVGTLMGGKGKTGVGMGSRGPSALEEELEMVFPNGVFLMVTYINQKLGRFISNKVLISIRFVYGISYVITISTTCLKFM